MKCRLGFFIFAFLFTLFGTTLTSAQVDLSPGVARISLIHGDVSTQRGDTGDWSAAVLNQPIVAGDYVATGQRSRAEVQLDHADILRLGNNAEAKIATLTRTEIQVQISQGLVYYTVFKDSDAQVEIDTPNVAVRPTSREGVYRIEVSGGETRVIVRKGEADISTPQGSTRVKKGESAIVRGTASDAEYKLADAPSKDSWDSWNSERDGAIRNAQSWGRTNRYYVGSEDLDAYGRWIRVPEYGYVWSPWVGVGWAPYRLGRWVWQPYWGWTWVSYEPWGWAPYHYGRWFLYGGSWVWWPGPVYRTYYRPIWAPAYVSFFGFGGNWGVSFGFGSVGWLPVGPCDRFFPWWGRHRSRFNVVNITNINIVNIRGGGFDPLRRGNRYSNLRLVGENDRLITRAISTVPAHQFGTGRIAPREVSREDFRNGRMLAGNVPIVPTRATTSASDRPANGFTPRGGREQRFFTKSRPAPAPEPFDRQAAQVQDEIRRSGRFTPVRAGERAETPALFRADARTTTLNRDEAHPPRAGEPGRGAATTPSRGEGWRRFGADTAQNRSTDNPVTTAAPRWSPSTADRARDNSQNQQRERDSAASSDRSGWRRFSDSNFGERGSRQAPSVQRNENRNPPRSDVTNERPSQRERPASRSDGWQQFSQQPSAAIRETPGRESQMTAPGNRDAGREGPMVFREDRGSAGRDGMQSSRPPLNLRQPIVTPRGDREVGRDTESGGGQGVGRSDRQNSGASRGGSGQRGGGSRGNSGGRGESRNSRGR